MRECCLERTERCLSLPQARVRHGLQRQNLAISRMIQQNAPAELQGFFVLPSTQRFNDGGIRGGLRLLRGPDGAPAPLQSPHKA